MYSLLDQLDPTIDHLVCQDFTKMYCLYCTSCFTTYFQQNIRSLLAFVRPWSFPSTIWLVFFGATHGLRAHDFSTIAQ